jgi:hypothetical protein
MFPIATNISVGAAWRAALKGEQPFIFIGDGAHTNQDVDRSVTAAFSVMAARKIGALLTENSLTKYGAAIDAFYKASPYERASGEDVRTLRRAYETYNTVWDDTLAKKISRRDLLTEQVKGARENGIAILPLCIVPPNPLDCVKDLTPYSRGRLEILNMSLALTGKPPPFYDDKPDLLRLDEQ